MDFIEAFRKVIDNVDPVANSKMTHDNTPIKVLADWARMACKEIEKHRWIPVEEGLPEKRQYILVYSPKTEMVTAVFANDGIDFVNVYTHWKPITLPTGETK